MWGALPTIQRRRVVVTGMGCVSPVGLDVASTWQAILAGRSGGRPLSDAPFFVADSVKAERRDAILTQLPCKIGCPVIAPPTSSNGKAPKDPFAPTRSEPRYTRFALAAAKEALGASSLDVGTTYPAERVGVNVGVGMTPLHDVGDVYEQLYGGDAPRYNRITPFFVPKILANMASGAVSMQSGARGPVQSNVTACATGAHCIGEAARAIQLGSADAMICGATESALNAVGIAGFARMRALSTKYNDTPETASRPFDEGRDGFVMGEGAGVLVLEELEAARARNAPIIAEVRGYGASGDAHHMSAPHPDGIGGAAAVRAALSDGGVGMRDVGYVNAHATSTPVGDGIELGALQRLVTEAGGQDARPSPLLVSSSKGSLGHLLGAAGAVEAIVTLLALKERHVPPTANLQNPIAHDTGLVSLVQTAQRDDALRTVVSSSFGFGGTNAALLFTSAE